MRSDSVTFGGSILWSYFQNDIKSTTSICSFEERITVGVGMTATAKFANIKTFFKFHYI